MPVSLFNEWECPDHRAISMKHRGKCCPTCVAYADHILLAQQDSHFQQALTRARVEQQRLYYEWFEQHREGGRRATAALAEAREENAKLQAQIEKLSDRLRAAWSEVHSYRARTEQLEEQLKEQEWRRTAPRRDRYGRPTPPRRSQSPRRGRYEVAGLGKRDEMHRQGHRPTQRERLTPSASSSSMPGPSRPQSSTDPSHTAVDAPSFTPPPMTRSS